MSASEGAQQTLHKVGQNVSVGMPLPSEESVLFDSWGGRFAGMRHGYGHRANRRLAGLVSDDTGTVLHSFGLRAAILGAGDAVAQWGRGLLIDGHATYDPILLAATGHDVGDGASA